MSSISETDSPYTCLYKHLPNFKDLEFSSQMMIICECAIPLPNSTATVLTVAVADCVFIGMVYIDGTFTAYVDITDIVNDKKTSHADKIIQLREMFVSEGIVTAYQIETVILL